MASIQSKKRLSTYLAITGSDGLPVPISTPVIGVLEGAGIGPAVIKATLGVLKSVQQVWDLKFEVRSGGLIGEDAILHCGQWLPEETM